MVLNVYHPAAPAANPTPCVMLRVPLDVILTQGHVTYNITNILFDFNLFLHFERIFRVMLTCQTPKIDMLIFSEN